MKNLTRKDQTTSTLVFIFVLPEQDPNQKSISNEMFCICFPFTFSTKLLLALQEFDGFFVLTCMAIKYVRNRMCILLVTLCKLQKCGTARKWFNGSEQYPNV